jgi:hypothetical protein
MKTSNYWVASLTSFPEVGVCQSHMLRKEAEETKN